MNLLNEPFKKVSKPKNTKGSKINNKKNENS